MHTFTLQVPDTVYEILAQRARHQGRSLEELVSAALTSAVGTLGEEGFMRWGGSITSGVSDAAEQHDRYLGQALHQKLNGVSDA